MTLTSAPSVAPSESSAEGRPSPYGWFVVLWPLAVVFHLAGNDFHLVTLSSTGLLQIPFGVAAVAMLVRPSANKAFVLAMTHLPVVVSKLPQVGNHEILLLLVHLAVIFAVVARRKDWVNLAAPAMRWVLLIGYSAIAFSKLNSSFVDRAVSCAVIFGDEFAEWVNVSVSDSAALSNMVIALTIIAEVSIPLMLMYRPLRRYGIALGLVFHSLLALEPNGHVFDFTSVLFILFLLFLTPTESERLRNAVDKRHAAFGTRGIVGVVLVMAIGNFLVHALRTNGVAFPRWLFDYPIWLAYATFLLRTVLSPGARTDDRPAEKLVFRLAPIMAVVVLLTSLNAASPYLELRTAGAFNMYSNLSTFDGETNHFLLPATLPLRDTPELYSYTPDPQQRNGLDFYAPDGFLVPEANIARWARTYPAVDVEVFQVGNSPEMISVRDLAGEVGGFSNFTERVLYIRAVDPTSPTACRRYWGPAH